MQSNKSHLRKAELKLEPECTIQHGMFGVLKQNLKVEMGRGGDSPVVKKDEIMAS